MKYTTATILLISLLIISIIGRFFAKEYEKQREELYNFCIDKGGSIPQCTLYADHPELFNENPFARGK
jgi:hypothetical protein